MQLLRVDINKSLFAPEVPPLLRRGCLLGFGEKENCVKIRRSKTKRTKRVTKGKSEYSSGEDHGTQRNSVTYRYKRETMAVEEPLLPTATLYPADNDDCEGGV